MRHTIGAIFTMINEAVMALTALCTFGREAAEELRDDAREERAKRAKQLAHPAEQPVAEQ